LVPWVGGVRVKRSAVPFRQPPESEITVTDYAVCDRVMGDLANKESDLVTAIRAAALGGG
jgi:hypothetical protein